jgi:hypothetical protein
MIVVVKYKVPVYVTVDVAKRRVESVQVDDTSAEPTGEIHVPEAKYASQAQQAAAKRIAEEAEWPAWEFGL